MKTKMPIETKIAVDLMNEYLNLSFKMKLEPDADEKRILVYMMLTVKNEMEKFVKAAEATYDN